MRRVAGLVGALGLVAGATAACGPETAEEQARIVGFASGIDAVIVQDEWVQHTGESSLPWSGQVRNKRHYEEFTGCREVDNSIQPEDFYEDEPTEDTYDSWDYEDTADDWDFDVDYGYGSLYWPYDESDDSECRDDWCSSDDFSHCEAVHEDRYDYERLETKTVKSCPAPVVMTMDKPSRPAIDTECIDDRSELQRVEQTAWYIVSVTVNNPFYDSKNNPREVLSANIPVSPEAWAGLNPGGKIDVIIADDQTVKKQ